MPDSQLTDADVANCWDNNAEAWTTLTRAGSDVCRDAFNTPTFLKMLPEVDGLRGLDVGCGEGHNTRLVARLGAKMKAIDISRTFIQAAIEQENRVALRIQYSINSARSLPFEDSSFDFVMSTMCFMDFPHQEEAVAEIVRVLKPGGFFQFSITHPATNTPIRYWIKDESGKKQALAIAGYFQQPYGDIEEWTFGATPEALKGKFEKFRVPRFQRTLSGWVNLIANSGLNIEQMEEPRPDADALQKFPREYDAALIPMFLIIRARNPVPHK